MSVYTSVSRQQLERFLQPFEVGRVESFVGISAGIINSNYFLDTARGRYVLTLFETLGFDEVPFFLDLTAFLATRQLPCAAPIPDRNGICLHELNARPTALVMRLEGNSVTLPHATQCLEVGHFMGRMHSLTPHFTGQRPSTEHSLQWCLQQATALQPRVAREDWALLQEELDYEQQQPREELPSGIIHSDLFRDNALFAGDQLTGVLDFYCACHGSFLYDLAVAVNDWCQGDPALTRALLHGYQQARSVSAAETACWPAMLRAAALRFWLSRLVNQHFPKAGELTHVKVPHVFRDLLRHHVAQGARLREPWFQAPDCRAR